MQPAIKLLGTHQTKHVVVEHTRSIQIHCTASEEQFTCARSFTLM
jgi:hypothetical protein